MKRWEFSKVRWDRRTIASAQSVTRDRHGYSVGLGWSLSLELEPRDLWVGVYWNRSGSGGMLDVYVCLVPCFPLHLTLWGLK